MPSDPPIHVPAMCLWSGQAWIYTHLSHICLNNKKEKGSSYVISLGYTRLCLEKKTNQTKKELERGSEGERDLLTSLAT